LSELKRVAVSLATAVHVYVLKQRAAGVALTFIFRNEGNFIFRYCVTQYRTAQNGGINRQIIV
jgi:hypothetical protein